MKSKFVILACSTALLGGCGSGPSGSINVEIGPVSVNAAFAQQAAAQFKTVWSTFDRDYALFGVKQVDWDAIRAKYEARALASQSQAELNTVLVEMLGSLKDMHVRLTARDGTQLSTYSDPRPLNYDLNQLAGWFAQQSGVMIGTSLGYARIPGGAYLGVASWAGAFTEGDLDAALEAVRDAPALIIDVRMNPGGNDTLAAALGARFTEVARIMHYSKTRNGAGRADFDPLTARVVQPRGPWTYKGKVIVLVGPRSASATESFVSLMRTIPNVTVIGERTAGSSGNPASYALTGDWSFTVSRWVCYTPDMQLIEGQGIAPDVTVQATPSDFAQGQDPVLAAALQRLN